MEREETSEEEVVKGEETTKVRKCVKVRRRTQQEWELKYTLVRMHTSSLHIIEAPSLQKSFHI